MSSPMFGSPASPVSPTAAPPPSPRCINGNCGRALEPGACYCPFCATEQPVRIAAGEGLPAFSPAQEPLSSAAAAEEVLVLRASEEIWQFEESERSVRPGERRPLLVLDEQIVHLAHTDRHLTPETLLERVRALLAAQGVPVATHLLLTVWQNDAQWEARPRVVASLRLRGEGSAARSSPSDVRMLLGVDYLGRWASVHMDLAVEPEPLPARPAPGRAAVWPVIVAAALLIVGLLLVTVGPMLASALLWMGFQYQGWLYGWGALFALVGLVWLPFAIARNRRRAAEAQAAWQERLRQRERDRQRERLSRTFRVDDARLFASAMTEVFRAVVDDIVRQGGEVARVEGGQGGFFSDGGLARAAPAARTSDAALAAV